MIKIEVENNNGLNYPSRELSDSEKKTVTSVHCDGIHYVYYQGDEPKREIIDEPIIEHSGVDISGIDIDTLTDEQLLKLKTRLGL